MANPLDFLNSYADAGAVNGYPSEDGFEFDTSVPAPMGWMPSAPVELNGGIDLPMGQPEVAVPQNFSQKIQEFLGARQPDSGGMAADILSNRFNTGTSYGDYASGIVQSALGKPTLGTDVGQSRMNQQLEQMAAMAKIQQLQGGGEFGQLVNAYQSMPDTDPRKQLYKDKIDKETTVTSLFGPIAGVDPVTNMPKFGTKGDAAMGGLKPPAPTGMKYTPDGRIIPSEPSTRDAMRLQKSTEAASAAAGIERLSQEAMGILKRYPTDRATKIRGETKAWYDVFSDNPSEQEIQDYQALVRISNDMGAIGLQQFGGNDTDRELQIAITAGINPNNVTGSNMNAAHRKMLAASILQQRPVFEEEWLNTTGSLASPDPQTGETFSSAWMKIQKQMWNEGLKKMGSGMAPEVTPSNDLSTFSDDDLLKALGGNQ